MPDSLRMNQELAEILPDESLDLLGRDKAGAAWGVAVGVQGRELATAAVIAMAGVPPAVVETPEWSLCGESRG
jgi:hypothetical protein